VDGKMHTSSRKALKDGSRLQGTQQVNKE